MCNPSSTFFILSYLSKYDIVDYPIKWGRNCVNPGLIYDFSIVDKPAGLVFVK